MKRFLIIMLFIIAIFCAFIFSTTSLESVFGIEKNNVKILKKIELGFVSEISESKSSKKYTLDGNVVGECVTLDSDDESVFDIIEKLGLMVISRYNIEDFCIIEGYSAKVPYSLDNRQSNIQIAVKSSEIVIGSPLILGSY